jgi:hypothetical protein
MSLFTGIATSYIHDKTKQSFSLFSPGSTYAAVRCMQLSTNVKTGKRLKQICTRLCSNTVNIRCWNPPFPAPIRSVPLWSINSPPVGCSLAGTRDSAGTHTNMKAVVSTQQQLSAWAGVILETYITWIIFEIFMFYIKWKHWCMTYEATITFV